MFDEVTGFKSQKNSIQLLKNNHKEIMLVCKIVSLVFLATKADLENERLVERDEGSELANTHGMCMFIETSSKSNLNVDNAFLELACQLKRQYEAGVHLDSQLDAFKISQGTTTVSSKWASCCRYL